MFDISHELKWITEFKLQLNWRSLINHQNGSDKFQFPNKKWLNFEERNCRARLNGAILLTVGGKVSLSKL